MQFSKKQLEQAAEQNIISTSQIEPLYQFLAEDAKNIPQFNFTHILYYFGGLVAIAAMSLFLGLSWESFGGGGIVAICLVYAAVGLGLTQYFANKGASIPAGICATFVVCLVPLAIFGVQDLFGMVPKEMQYQYYYDYIKSHYLYMEFGTLLAAILVGVKYRYPFLMLPLTIALWFAAMDLTALMHGEALTWEIRRQVSICTGLVMLLSAVVIDKKLPSTPDYAFWLYLVGALSFWGGVTMLESETELTKFGYFCINLVMIGVGALLSRRIFAILGALGSFGYLAYLASKIFKDDWLFPIALTILGLAMVYLGMLWQKWQEKRE